MSFDGRRAQIQELIDRWRAKFPASATKSSDDYYAGQANGTLKCSDQLEILLAALSSPSPSEQDSAEAYGYLRRLFEFCAPQCRPSDHFPTLATQIDNYIAGLRSRLAERSAPSETLAALKKEIASLELPPATARTLVNGDMVLHLWRPDCRNELAACGALAELEALLTSLSSPRETGQEQIAANILSAKYLNPECAESGCQFLQVAAPPAPEQAKALIADWRARAQSERDDNWCNTEMAPVWRAIHDARADVFDHCARTLEASEVARPRAPEPKTVTGIDWSHEPKERR